MTRGLIQVAPSWKQLARHVSRAARTFVRAARVVMNVAQTAMNAAQAGGARSSHPDERVAQVRGRPDQHRQPVAVRAF